VIGLVERSCPPTFLRYYYASVFLAIICFSCAIIAIGVSGYANIVEQSIIGTGDLYTRHDSASASDLASVSNATAVYESKLEWESGSKAQTFSSSFIVSGASSKGGFRNQYVVKASGAGYKHVYRATAISGEFAGSGEVSLTLGEDGAESLDSLILMDSRNGNATFQGRIYNSQSGRPVTAEEMDAVGRFVIRSYLNVSQPIVGPDNWLGFCESLDRDNILAHEGGFYVIPPGYKLDDRMKLVRLNSTG
jgi:hypothetical protein